MNALRMTLAWQEDRSSWQWRSRPRSFVSSSRSFARPAVIPIFRWVGRSGEGLSGAAIPVLPRMNLAAGAAVPLD